MNGSNISAKRDKGLSSMAARYGGWELYLYQYKALGSWRNLRIVGDMATMEGLASVPIYAIAATDRDNKLLL